jgi:hypothetical protein
MLGFVMFRAVRDAHGRFLGGALGFFNGNTMNDMFRKMEAQGFDLGQGGAMAVLDRDNAVQLARMGANDGSQLNTSDPRLAKLLEYASDTAQVQRYTSPIDGVERMGYFLTSTNANGCWPSGWPEKTCCTAGIIRLCGRRWRFWLSPLRSGF